MILTLIKTMYSSMRSRLSFFYTLSVLLALTFFIHTSKAQSFSPEQIEQLTAPIALYPDLLVSLILPSSTTPSDIGDAAFYLLGGGDVSLINQARWAPSVKALSRYSQVVVWMSYNTPWVEQLGTAYTYQEIEVLDSIQRLRQRAIIDGVLKDTNEQRVVIIDSIIYIEPADPELIYIPIYDPNACFSHRTLGLMGPWIFFDRPYYMGPWLTYGCDWRNHHIVSNLRYDSKLSRSQDIRRFEGAKIFNRTANHPAVTRSFKEIPVPTLQPGAPQIHAHSPRVDNPRPIQQNPIKQTPAPKAPLPPNQHTDRQPTTPNQLRPPPPKTPSPQTPPVRPLPSQTPTKQDDPKK